MKSIMVDMDDVLTYGTFQERAEKFLGKKIDVEKCNGYYIQDELFGDRKDEFFDMLKDENLYENASLIPDCYEVLKELNDEYNIYICTDYIWKEMIKYAGNNAKNKYDFLYEKLEFLNPRNYIFTGDKSVVKCDIKIDDKICNIEDAETKLLYTARHNKNISDEELSEKGIIRVNNWGDIKKLLLKK